MWWKTCNALLLWLLPVLLNGQASLNMTLIGSWQGTALTFNDIWGYRDGLGNEYALVGSLTKVHVLQVAANGSVSIVGEITGGGSSIWRDMKTFSHYAYSVADQGTEGLMVIELKDLPNSVSLANRLNTQFFRAHNIFIDTQHARLYVAGSNGGTQSAPNGLMVYDLSVDAGNPTLLASVSLPGTYVHDVFVRDNIAYCSHGTAGLYVYNMSNPGSPVTLGSLTNYLSQGYNHSGWLNDDGHWYVFADETHGTKLKIADVSDLSNITVTASNLFQECLLAPGNTGCIPHNPFIVDNLVYVSYYHDGLQVFDISDPDAVVRVAYYDTYPYNTNYSGYQGDWGVYPFLPSGNILVSDISSGLYVLRLSGALPVTLISFTGKARDGKVDLFWSTQLETNCDFYEIQHSRNGQWFEAIGTVPGNGTTTARHDYQSTDDHPVQGVNYYRLRQVDFNGEAHFSKIISVIVPATTRWEVYPTLLPANAPAIHVIPPRNADGDYTFRLFDDMGRELTKTSKEALAGELLEIQLASNPPGVYFLSIEGESGQTTIRLLFH